MGTFVRLLHLEGMKLIFVIVITAVFCATHAASIQEKKKGDHQRPSGIWGDLRPIMRKRRRRGDDYLRPAASWEDSKSEDVRRNGNYLKGQRRREDSESPQIQKFEDSKLEDSKLEDSLTLW